MTTSYLYNHNMLFPHGGKTWPEEGELPASMEGIEPLILECINVKPVGNDNFMGASTWDFQVVGHGDQWYRTHYAWALIENTPENIALAREFHGIHEQRAQLQRQAIKVFKKIKNLKHGDYAQ